MADGVWSSDDAPSSPHIPKSFPQGYSFFLVFYIDNLRVYFNICPSNHLPKEVINDREFSSWRRRYRS
jgi:hypothetical protein